MNWDAHFRALSRGEKRSTADFGTILGRYTVAELQDLINSKDDEMSNLAKYAAQASAGWQSDFQKLSSDYAFAKQKAQTILDMAKRDYLTPDSINTAGDEPYRLILSTLNPRWESHDASTDRGLSLMQRLNAENVKVAPYSVRQPRQTSDAPQYVSLQAKRAVDAAAKAAEDAGKKVFQWSRPVLIAAAVVAGVLGFVLVKPYLPTPSHPQLGTS